MTVGEKALLDRIAQGDESALAALYDAYRPRLARFCLRIVRDPDLVAEIVNDVFLVVWRSAARFRGDSAVSTWILGIAYRKALKCARRHRPSPPAPEAETGTEMPTRGMDIETTLAQLNGDQRATIELVYFFGYSCREVGEIMGCPENTVKTRMFHARKTLRTLLET